MVDAIVYINLAHRKDRMAHILIELEKISEMTTNIHRIDAVLEPLCGHLGCGKSHVKALELAVENNWESVLIVEDDLQFTESVDCKRMADVFSISWDVMLLGLGHHIIKPSPYSYLNRVVSTTCTHGYIIRRHYYKTLLDNFRTGVEKMTTELQNHIDTCKREEKPVSKLHYCSAIDQEWFRLQSKDTFYVFEPQFGIQQNNTYSDNNCSIEHQQEGIRKAQ